MIKDVRSHYSLMAQDYIDQYDKKNIMKISNTQSIIIDFRINIKFSKGLKFIKFWMRVLALVLDPKSSKEN